MKRFKQIVAAGLILGLAALVTACGTGENKATTAESLSTKTITVGVTTGPHELIMKQVAKLAKADGLTIKLTQFTDYNSPNTALNQGDLQANSYQTEAFLNTQNRTKGHKLTAVFKTVAFPMGVYSKSIRSLDALKDSDSIAVPNDPANELRALKLFEAAGVLKLRASASTNATKADVVENPRHLKIVELDAAQLPSHLADVAAAAINTNFAYDAGLTLNKDAIFHEPTKDNPYPNYFVVQTKNAKDPLVKKLKGYYQSKTIQDYIDKTFGGSIVPAW